MRASVALLLLSWLAAGCGPQQPEPRLVLLYATCSLNQRFLQPYDGSVSFTPALEEFAREAVVFERHRTESGQSGVSFASLFTGTQADGHGVYFHPTRLPVEADLVTEAFAEAGWEVHSWLGQRAAAAWLDYAQGVPDENRHGRALAPGDADFLRVLDRAATDPDARVMVVTNNAITHGPYGGYDLAQFCNHHPKRCEARGRADFNPLRRLYVANHIPLSIAFEDTRRRLALSEAKAEALDDVVRLLYEASVFHLDRQFGDLVEAIDERGLRDASVLAFTSDHGEVFAREGSVFRWTHGFQLAPEVLDVAFLLRAPGLEPRRFPGVTRSIDVFPTLVGLSGIGPAGGGVRGVDLSPALRREAQPPRLQAFSHTAVFPRAWWERWNAHPVISGRFPSRDPSWMWVSVREGDLVAKLVHLGEGRWEHEVFDLDVDPTERKNLYDSADPAHSALFAALADYKAGLLEAYPEDREAITREQEVETLRALGYIE